MRAFTWSIIVAAACGGTPSGPVPGQPDATTCEPLLALDDGPGMASTETLFPTPHHATAGAIGPVATPACLDTRALPHHATVDAMAAELFASVRDGLACECAWWIVVSTEPPALDGEAAATWTRAQAAADRFALVTELVDGRAHTTIHATTERGAWYGLLAASELVHASDGGPRVPAATVVDYPDFASRGILEGFYGTPYSAAERATTIRLAAQLHQDVYLYGPKTDDFARARWADPYPPDRAADLAAAAAVARDHLVRFIWSISPGLPFGNLLPGDSIRYASDDDFARLTAKLESVRALGVTEFALFLDDLAGFLPWPEDQARFASLAEAHAFLINRLDDYLTSIDPAAHLIVVGSEYTSLWPTWRPYNEELGTSLHDDIEVLWTGPGIYSTTIDAGDLADIDAVLHRRVGIWDNQPQNVGPLEGRSVDLPTAAQTFYSNPVVNEFGLHPPSAFWQVQGTLADYAWNPAAYVPATSFERWSALRAP